MACAKQTAVPIILIGHVTKEGAIAGPRTLEHMVDVVLYLEGDRHGDHRLLRGVKNRFGATGEAGLLVMTETGMQEVDAGSRAFFEEASLGVPGNCLTLICEGSRAFAVEVQALTVKSSFGLPRRTASGFDLGRLHVILAVLERRAAIKLDQTDVYVNVVGGIKLNEPAADLAVALAVASAKLDLRCRRIAQLSVSSGWAGNPAGRQLGLRLNEANAVGISKLIVPPGSRESAGCDFMKGQPDANGSKGEPRAAGELVEVGSLQQARIRFARGNRASRRGVEPLPDGPSVAAPANSRNSTGRDNMVQSKRCQPPIHPASSVPGRSPGFLEPSPAFSSASFMAASSSTATPR